MSPPRRRLAGAAVALALTLLAGVAAADRRYFLLTYTPYLGPAGESEAEFWLSSKLGKQDPAVGPGWESRAEWEYGITSRLTGAAYFNFVRPPEGRLEWESSSVELIYRPTEEGRVWGDPALYLEATESGDELELEPKLLLAHRFGGWVAATNLVGEFEFRHNDQELLANGEVLRDGVAGEATLGLAYGIGRSIAVGLEARARTEHPNFGRQAAALVSAGPSVSLELGHARLALGVLPQVTGLPRTSGHRNLVDFEKAEVRAIAGFEF